tara:strand:+ start:71 stop:907 length:837 start_codon:yes stop_codon:yes gene_type:complete
MSKSKKRTHQNMPSHIAIASYWQDKVYEGDIGIDWADQPHKRCWRCGRMSKNRNVTQKCHIIPSSLGGGNKPENIVLLCAFCHKEAPNANCKDVMWTWLKNTSTSLYDTLHSFRAFEEYEKIYGIKFQSELQKVFTSKFPEQTTSDNKIFFEFFGQFYSEKLISNSTIHFGEGQINASTKAFLLRDVLLALKEKTEWTISKERLKELEDKSNQVSVDFLGEEKKGKRVPRKQTPMTKDQLLEKHNDIKELLQQGSTASEIVKLTGKSSSTVYKIQKIL